MSNTAAWISDRPEIALHFPKGCFRTYRFGPAAHGNTIPPLFAIGISPEVVPASAGAAVAAGGSVAAVSGAPGARAAGARAADAPRARAVGADVIRPEQNKCFQPTRKHR